MSLEDNRRDAGRKSDQTSSTAKPGQKRRGGNSEVGNALRSAYQRAIDEDIPPEMLDLLGKLG